METRKVAIVTGVSSGIGRETALRFVEGGLTKRFASNFSLIETYGGKK